jgi:hypothetical protein
LFSDIILLLIVKKDSLYYCVLYVANSMIFTEFCNHIASTVCDLKPFQDFVIAVVIVIIDYCQLMPYSTVKKK